MGNRIVSLHYPSALAYEAIFYNTPWFLSVIILLNA